MVRGVGKAQAQKRAAKKAAKVKKSKKGKEAKADRKKALKWTCPICKVECTNLKMGKVHFESKHSKLPLPEDLKNV